MGIPRHPWRQRQLHGCASFANSTISWSMRASHSVSTRLRTHCRQVAQSPRRARGPAYAVGCTHGRGRIQPRPSIYIHYKSPCAARAHTEGSDPFWAGLQCGECESSRGSLRRPAVGLPGYGAREERASADQSPDREEWRDFVGGRPTYIEVRLPMPGGRTSDRMHA